MSLKILLHGVSDEGQKIAECSTDKEKMLFKSFFGNIQNLPEVNTALAVHILEENGQKHIYYTFWMRTISRSGMNTGGNYFGITIKDTEIYKDFDSMYNVLKDTWKSFFRDTVFERFEDGYKLKNSFLSAADVSRIERALTAYLNEFVSGNDVIDHISSEYKAFSRVNNSFNIDEFTFGEAQNLLKRGDAIFVSPDYPSNRAKEIEARYKKTIQELEISCSKKQREVEGLNQNLEETMESLKSERRKRLETEKERDELQNQFATLENHQSQFLNLKRMWNEAKLVHNKIDSVFSQNDHPTPPVPPPLPPGAPDGDHKKKIMGGGEDNNGSDSGEIQTYPDTSRNNKDNKIIIAILAGIVLIGLVIILFFWAVSHKGKRLPRTKGVRFGEMIEKNHQPNKTTSQLAISKEYRGIEIIEC